MTCVVEQCTLGGPDADVEYEVLPGVTHRLVRQTIVVKCSGIAPGSRVITLPKSALPFGLLEGVALQGSAPCDVTLRFTKATGMADCSLVPPAWRCAVGIVSQELCNTYDAVDPDLAAIKDATGHVMAWRMIAGTAVGEMTLTLDGTCDAPPTLTLVVFGANAVPVAISDAQLQAMDPGARIRAVLLPPLPPPVRLRRLETRTAEVAATKPA